ncbi:hypothetical protein RCL1_004914 [Eukaryota sp. TZLM3-RCL]
MMVAPNHSFVAPNGRCDSLSFLSSWQPSSSNLVNLVAVLSREFGLNPPVHAKSSPQPPAAQYQSHNPHQPSQFTQPPNPYPPQGYPNQYPGQTPHHYPHGPTPVPMGNPSVPPVGVNVMPSVLAKVKKEFSTLYQDASQELNALKQDQQLVVKSLGHLNAGEQQMQADKIQLERNINILQERISLINSELNSAQDNSTPKTANETVQPVDAWSRQLLEAKAEDTAIEDVLFSLKEAVGYSQISLEDFMKQSRDLCRKQFYCRELGKKISTQRRSLGISV